MAAGGGFVDAVPKARPEYSEGHAQIIYYFGFRVLGFVPASSLILHELNLRCEGGFVPASSLILHELNLRCEGGFVFVGFRC